MFRVLKQSKKSRARVGVLTTKHGKVLTPFFMPIGTKGIVKSLSPFQLEKTGAQILLCNALHLFFQPGLNVIKKAKNLHNFICWQKPILTDSGGYQIFSLFSKRKVRKEGVEFKSEISGEKVFLTPQKCLQIQKILDSDIWMVLDECPPYTENKKIITKATERTILWAKESKKILKKWKKKNLVFGIIQGGVFKDLREKNFKEVVSLDFDGYSIGGLFVGEPLEKTFEISRFLSQILPRQKPRYLMGGAWPEQIIEFVKMGIDMFDCVIPSRHARHGEAFVFKKQSLTKNFYEVIDLKKSKYKLINSPIDKNCDCHTCQNFSVSFLHHAFRIKDPLAGALTTIHNLRFYTTLMKKIRQNIRKNLL